MKEEAQFFVSDKPLKCRITMSCVKSIVYNS